MQKRVNAVKAAGGWYTKYWVSEIVI
jgi:hypothetical protein